MAIFKKLIEASRKRLDFDPIERSKEVGEIDRGRFLSIEQRDSRFQRLLDETGNPERARSAFERIIGGNDLVNINFLEKGLIASRAICRIQLRNRSGRLLGYATGFLIGPEVLLTNNHVFKRKEDATYSIADFNYELDITNYEKPVVRFSFHPEKFFYANEELDFAIVAIAPTSKEGNFRLEDWGWLSLSPERGKANVGEYLTIIQHPEGRLKQICVRENKLLKFMDQTLWYQTDTLGGSSGSPVFNMFWQIAALHHSGVPEKDDNGNWLTHDGAIWDSSMGESRIKWIANEGIRISSIVKHLQDNLGNHPLIKKALEFSPPKPKRYLIHDSYSSQEFKGSIIHTETKNDFVSLIAKFPLEIIGRELPPQSLSPSVLPPDSIPTERVEIDHTNLNKRPGYKDAFLGSKHKIPLPQINENQKSKIAYLNNSSTDFVLKYYNYSVVMNKEKKLAFFVAVNIDGGLRRDVGRRRGDRWLFDPRIDENVQIGNEFYKRQRLDESRTNNPFDRGHLVRRLDATWGDTKAEAKRNGDDTFHFTNCAPQFFKFNQGRKLWLGIEEYVLDQLEAEKRRGCVFNGPIFDGPLTPTGTLPNPEDFPHSDPKFKKIPIPKFFWKLIVILKNRKLVATAFLLSQQDQVLDIDRIEEGNVFERLSTAETFLYQISINDLEKLTNIDFGKLKKVDTKETSEIEQFRLIRNLEDIRF
ncbi:MAG: Glutamyl endopeptidase precursor [Candidatus Heimdallarchaeota archaeon LC_3]|nr:MAG: Glutamyl endopeptidase precursor [Candidatus Heimdallarchaeota archaeon LC_3]